MHDPGVLPHHHVGSDIEKLFPSIRPAPQCEFGERETPGADQSLADPINEPYRIRVYRPHRIKAVTTNNHKNGSNADDNEHDRPAASRAVRSGLRQPDRITKMSKSRPVQVRQHSQKTFSPSHLSFDAIWISVAPYIRHRAKGKESIHEDTNLPRNYESCRTPVSSRFKMNSR